MRSCGALPQVALDRQETLGWEDGVRSHGVVGDDGLAGIERWFVERGLPHFVERHDTATEIWGRALPWLVAAYLLLGLNALDLSEWSVATNLVVAGFVVLGAIVTWLLANRLRRRGWFERPHRIGAAELVVFTLVPAVPSLLVGQWGDAVQTVLTAIAILAVLWAITSYGVVPLMAWAWQRTLAQVPLLFSVLVRALPLLLLFTTFLFINAEVWQVAGTLTGIVYVATLGVFFLLGALFTLSRVPALIRALNRFDSWTEVEELAVGTPAMGVVATAPAGRGPVADRPTMRQRVNIGLVTIFSQAIPITFVGLVPHRVLRDLRVPGDPGADRRGVDDARRRRRARPLVGRRAHARRHRAAHPGRRLPRGVRGDVLHRPPVDGRDLPRGVR